MGGAEDAGVGGDGVADAARSLPGGEIEGAGGVDAVNPNVLVSEGRSGLADLGRAGSL